MKFAIPTNNKKLCLHFGHCEVFTFIEVDKTTNTIITKEEIAPPAHAPGVLPSWLAKYQTSIVIAGGMGSRAQNLFKEEGIDIIVGSNETDPEKAVLAYLNNTLKAGVNTCDH